ncbi:hypothetical protein [Salininema proteolyticum]|uniref:Uncharacterized protein n=1 Tax=Salininema proteolyticum TaxID=1607685 RepID=A0ABV8TXD8_9ACTN
MTVLYLPPDTTDLGTLHHYEHVFDVRHDADAGTVFLLEPTDDDTPIQERVPAVIAVCGQGVWAKLTLYSDELYKQARTFPDWENEIRDAIMIHVKRRTR